MSTRQQRQSVASRTVTQSLHRSFAELCGDWNPMHMDAIAARRTLAGQPVVHGIHSLLWALDSLAAESLLTKRIARAQVKLLKWLYPGDLAVLTIAAEDGVNPGGFNIQVHGVPVLTAQLSFADGSLPAEDMTDCAVLPRSSARLLSLPEMAGLTGDAFVAPGGAVDASFPAIAQLLGARAVAELAATSYIVGMEAPGLNSTFSKLDVTFRADSTCRASGLTWEVNYTDARFHKARIAVNGAALEGTLEVFVRLPPAEQPTMEQIAARNIGPDEFAGMTALIVGGSRGLGEVTAKIIAAGGGHALISYAMGRADAENVSAQIRDWGGAADTLPYDVRQPAGPQISSLPVFPSHVFYFATNPISQPRYQAFSATVFAEFTRFYVDGFYDLCTALLSAAGRRAGELRAYYPSSVFVDQRPAGMTEYAMAKAAGELLCQDMNVQLPGFNVSLSRLPRLPTDQTSGILPVRGIDPLDILIPIVRERMPRSD